MLQQLNLDDNFMTGEIPGDWSQQTSLVLSSSLSKEIDSEGICRRFCRAT